MKPALTLLLIWASAASATKASLTRESQEALLAIRVLDRVLDGSDQALNRIRESLPKGISSQEIEGRLGWNTNRNLRALRQALALGYRASWRQAPEWRIEFTGNPGLKLDSDLPFEVQEMAPLTADEVTLANEAVLKFWDGNSNSRASRDAHFNVDRAFQLGSGSSGAIAQMIERLQSEVAQNTEGKQHTFRRLIGRDGKVLLQPKLVDESLGGRAEKLLRDLLATRLEPSAEARVSAAFRLTDSRWLEFRQTAWNQFQIENRVRLWSLLFANRSLAYLVKSEYSRNELDMLLPQIIQDALKKSEDFTNRLRVGKARLQTQPQEARHRTADQKIDSEKVLEEYSYMIELVAIEDPSLAPAAQRWRERQNRKEAILNLFDKSIQLAMVAPMILFLAPETFLAASGATLMRAASASYLIGLFQAAGKSLEARLKRDKLIQLSRALWLLQTTADEEFDSRDIFEQELQLLDSQELDLLTLKSATTEVKKADAFLGSYLAPALVRPKVLIKFIRGLRP